MCSFSSDASTSLIVSEVWTALDWCLNLIKCSRKGGPTYCHKQELLQGTHTSSSECTLLLVEAQGCSQSLFFSVEANSGSAGVPKSLDLHWCKKSFSSQDLKRVKTKPRSKPYRPLTTVGEQFIGDQFILQTHALCALCNEWERNCFMLHPSPLCLAFWSLYFTGPVKNGFALARNSSDLGQIKKLSIFSIMCGRGRWNTWDDALLLSLSPKSTNLSIHFEINQWFAQKPKHMGTCCPVEWQAGDEIPRTCLCREWFLGAIWQLHQTAIWNITRGDVVLCLIYTCRKKKKKALFAFYGDTLLVVNTKFPKPAIHSLKSFSLCCVVSSR